jgi:14-3-3 protein epsilon
MSEPAPSDLLFFATIQLNLQRHSEAVSYIRQLILAKPALDPNERACAIVILKSAIDRFRKTLGVLDGALLLVRTEADQRRADALVSFQSKSFRELNELCAEILELIDKFLLPNSDGVEAEVFFYKFKGDLWRYLGEHFSNDSEAARANREAETAYLKGIDLANGLGAANPMRLGVIMNYGVFLYEHLYDVRRAIEVVAEAQRQAQHEIGALDAGEKAEAERILQLMRANLGNWDDGEEETNNEE